MGELVVSPWPLVMELPTTEHVVEATIGDAISLYGYDSEVRPDGRLSVTLYWQALSVPDRNYKVFVHVLEASNGAVLVQADSEPVQGLRPTRGWRVGEVITDAYMLQLPSGAAATEYQVLLGMYDPDDGVRPQIVVGGQVVPDGQLELHVMP